MLRRTFLQALSAAPAFASLNPSPTEYIATANHIDVRRRGVTIQRVPSARPAYLSLSAQRNVLFAVNEIDNYLGLPAGSVESYSVHPLSGKLTLLSRQSLSLSATMPRHFAIAPDGNHLVVAAYVGGAYNVLPVSSNGEIGQVTQILKEIGNGSHPERQRSSHPHSVVFHPSGKFLLGTDLGSDRINLFKFQEGRMTRIQQLKVQAGSGPGQITIDASGSRVTVQHELTSSTSRYHFDGQLYNHQA